uniref:X8 domain-containing protein n=1 Tax=Hordeum vulgare subsp. vulgare TaxID=112509 RepID=A0A8I7BC05_HORVV
MLSFPLPAPSSSHSGHRDGAPLLDLKRTLDYACGSAAECIPIQPSAACFAPDNVKAHCSYAVNSFYQRSGQKPLACVFSYTAVLSSVDPSANSSKYPATATPSLDHNSVQKYTLTR